MKWQSIMTIQGKMEEPSMLHEMAQSRGNYVSVRSNESASDEMAQYLGKLYRVSSNGTVCIK